MPTDVEPLVVAPAPSSPTAGEDVGDCIPLTVEQRDRWLACRLDPPNAPARVDLWMMDLIGPVRREALAAAVRAAGARHDALRVRYLPDGSGQSLDPVSAAPAAILMDLPASEHDAPLVARVHAEVKRRLDRDRGPLAGWWWAPHPTGGTLIFATHQLAMDPASARAVLRGVAADYGEAVRLGRTPNAALGAESFVAHAQAESHRIRSSSLAGDFWREKLALPPEPLELPADRSRPATPSHRGGEVWRDFPADFVVAVHTMAKREAVALADVLIAGWSALLHRLADSERFLVGVAVASGTGVVGPLLRFHPMMVSIDRETTFRELLRATARERADAATHAQADIGAIVRELRWPRDSARPWLFGVTFALEAAPEPLAFAGEEARVSHVPAPHHEGDLALSVVAGHDQLSAHCRFNVDVFDGATVRRWLGHFSSLLAAAARAPDTAVGRLEWLTPAERHDLVIARNPARAPTLAGPALLHELFSASAARRPDHPAVIVGVKALTYAELEARANCVARQLREHGAGPGRPVALLLDRSVEYAIATLAVLKAGAAFVPLDREWPEDRQEMVRRDCAARVLITAGRSPSPIPTGVHVVDLHTLSADGGLPPPSVAVSPNDLAYIIYTSGSTGQPKGVMIDHHAAATHMASIAQVYRIASDDRCLLFHSVAFDPAIEQLFAPWVVGATVYVRGDALWTGREFSAWVRREGITAVTLPPLYWLQLLRDWEQEPALAPVGQLRRVLVGGEALPPAVVELWRRLKLTSIRLLNGYGPTECTVTATVHELPPEPAVNESGGRIPIGRPQGPVEAYVLDALLQPQPIGVLGELCLAGPTLARGYLGRETLTRERFVPHPFRPGVRMYRTGDRARVLTDGTIDFCGRADRQVKVAGYRIEPGEIEAVLGRIDGVGAGAVVVEREPHGESVLVGYVVSADGGKLDHAMLRAELAARLPRYMVPARLVDVPELPRTINGKLDVAALSRFGAKARAREQEESLADRRRDACAARDELETRVAGIWCAALGRADVTPADNFFDCGGHSLIAVGLYARLEREFAVRLALRDWLAHPSFGVLVRLVRDGSGAEVVQPASPAWKFLFPINARGERPRLFLFAGGRGCDEDFVVLAALTRALGADQPVWGVRLGGPDRLRPMHADTAAMAGDVAREIRQLQPDGPYHLVGECIGGLLAFEVAQVLERAGAEVAFLGMINTGCPRFAESFRWWLRTTWVGRAKQMLPALAGTLCRSPWRELPRHLRAAAAQIWRSPFAGRPPRADGMPEDPKDYHYGKILLRYRPSPTHVPVTLFACETFKRATNLRRWMRHATAGVRMVPLLGNTTTCIREHARDSARQLRAELDRASDSSWTG